MASQAEEKRIAEFVERIRNAETPTAARMTALGELRWIHSRKKADGEKFSDLTNRKLIIAYRAALKQEFGEESEVLKYLHYSDARTKEYQAHQAETREAKHRAQRPIDPDEFINSALLLLGHAVKLKWSTAAVIAGVCALTGRRPYEVAVTGRFAPDPTNRDRILFGGQAKTRDDERAAAVYPFPVLGDRELVLQAVEMLRAKIEPMDNSTFSQRHAKEIGIKAKAAFKDAQGEEIKPRDLREAYAAIAYHVFAPKGISSVQYLNDILGHKTESLDTTLYYLGFYVD